MKKMHANALSPRKGWKWWDRTEKKETNVEMNKQKNEKTNKQKMHSFFYIILCAPYCHPSKVCLPNQNFTSNVGNDLNRYKIRSYLDMKFIKPDIQNQLV